MSLCTLPAWCRQEIPDTPTLGRRDLLAGYGVKTVCEEARCPNLGVCFKAEKLTFLILGTTCTRHCIFCAVDKNENNERLIEADEPLRVSLAVRRLKLGYVVLTSVTRDDLVDGGAAHFARTIETIRRFNPEAKVEALIPDFLGDSGCLELVARAFPEVIAHNIETVPRLYATARPEADYGRSQSVLKELKRLDCSIFTKSSLMVGLGETEEEVITVMKDLKDVSCDVFTIGQYLAPSALHYAVKEFVPPEKFKYYESVAHELGFKAVLSGPLVRSSFRAEEVYHQLRGI